MEKGNDLSRVLSTFIVLHILLEDIGVNYISQDKNKIFSILGVFEKIMTTQNLSSRLMRHIIRMYSLLSENKEIRIHMREKLPKILFDKRLYDVLNDSSKKHLKNLFRNLKPIVNTKGVSYDNDLSETKRRKNTQDHNIQSINPSLLYGNPDDLTDRSYNDRELNGYNPFYINKNIYNEANQNLLFDEGNGEYLNSQRYPLNLTNITNFNQITYTNFIHPQSFENQSENKYSKYGKESHAIIKNNMKSNMKGYNFPMNGYDYN